MLAPTFGGFLGLRLFLLQQLSVFVRIIIIIIIIIIQHLYSALKVL